jgi:ubiquinone/menaquinone biosynthesis C-methylase UbiE
VVVGGALLADELIEAVFAEVEQRATIATADMRKLPFEAAAFDAIVSAYAVDHLNRQGTDQALAEAARALTSQGLRP